MPVIVELGTSAYDWVKALHVVAIITWMAGLFYLPRLYVYHAETTPGSEQSETFKVMERRLLRGIMNPSVVVVFITGFMMFPVWVTDGWMHAKLTLVILMAVCHGFYARWRKDFLSDSNTRSHKFYRVANEIPTVLLLGIIALVIVKPF